MQMFAIVSGYNGPDPVENVLNHDDLVKDHVRPSPYQFREIIGCWNGTVEQAVQIYCPDSLKTFEFIEEMKKLGKLFDQEAILVVHSDSSGNLFYIDGIGPEVEVCDGTWQPLTLYKVKHEGCWSFIGGDFYGFDT